MMMQVPIRCPRCLKETDMLHFWRKEGSRYYHVCAKCLENADGFSIGDILQIGVLAGIKEAGDKVRKFAEEL